MEENTQLNPINFTLSETAKEYLHNCLAHFCEGTSSKHLVACLTFCGGESAERDGRIQWSHHGPSFLIAGIKPEDLGAGGYYDLLGQRVWISKAEQHLLSGRTLTTLRVGTDSPDPEELLVLDNAPEDYFEQILRLREGKW